MVSRDTGGNSVVPAPLLVEIARDLEIVRAALDHALQQYSSKKGPPASKSTPSKAPAPDPSSLGTNAGTTELPPVSRLTTVVGSARSTSGFSLSRGDWI